MSPGAAFAILAGIGFLFAGWKRLRMVTPFLLGLFAVDAAFTPILLQWFEDAYIYGLWGLYGNAIPRLAIEAMIAGWLTWLTRPKLGEE